MKVKISQKLITKKQSQIGGLNFGTLAMHVNEKFAPLPPRKTYIALLKSNTQIKDEGMGSPNSTNNSTRRTNKILGAPRPTWIAATQNWLLEEDGPGRLEKARLAAKWRWAAFVKEGGPFCLAPIGKEEWIGWSGLTGRGEKRANIGAAAELGDCMEHPQHAEMEWNGMGVLCAFAVRCIVQCIVIKWLRGNFFGFFGVKKYVNVLCLKMCFS